MDVKTEKGKERDEKRRRKRKWRRVKGETEDLMKTEG